MKELNPIKTTQDLCFEAGFIAVAIIVSYFYCKLKFLLNDGFPPLKFLVAIANNTGVKPWQYRILIPYAAKILYHAHLSILSDYKQIYELIEASSLFLLALTFRHYVNLFVRNRFEASLASLLIFFILPFHFFFPRPHYPNYWYDTPSILFFTLGMILIYRKKWVLYYILYIIASFNRETTCFLTVIYLFTSLGKERISKIFYHCGAQLLIWILIKLVLSQAYSHNAGMLFEFSTSNPRYDHIADNLAYFAHIKNYPMFFSVFGFTWIPVLFYHRLIHHDFIKRSLLAVFPFFLGMFCVSNIYELRVFEEMIPVFTVAFIVLLERMGDKTT